ncbi:MAG: helix-turn-helix domain-containing protein [Bryobacteraceae bacterium]|nr:helix-turn-helix domain-containing protein [Bryobacteraceae bacterium]
MVYEEFAPAPQLTNAVSYWRFALPASHQPASMLHTVPPDGAVNLCWLPASRAVLMGPRLAALRVMVEAGCEYTGVRFLPGAAGPLLGIDVRSIRDQLRPFPDTDFASVMQTSGLSGLDALLPGWARKVGWHGPDPVVAKLTRRIIESEGMAPVSDLTEGLNLSYRQALRRFHEASGLTPKEFARVRRMRSTCLRAVVSEDPQWAGLSADAGFADQAHLSREFRDIYGWPPRLVHEYLRRIEHLRVIG